MQGAASPLVATGVRSKLVPFAIAMIPFTGLVVKSTLASARLEVNAVGGGLGGSGTSKYSRIPGTYKSMSTVV